MKDAKQIQEDCICILLEGCVPLRTTNFYSELSSKALLVIKKNKMAQ